jgi:hypothetical protein
MGERQNHHQPQQQNHRALNAAVRADIHGARELHAPGTGADEDGDQAERALMALPECEI